MFITFGVFKNKNMDIIYQVYINLNRISNKKYLLLDSNLLLMKYKKNSDMIL